MTHPELAKEADGWDPSEITSGSNRILNWKCSRGHHFEASANTRIQQNAGCPFCSNRRVLVGYNDLATTHPDLACQAYGWDPTSVTFGSGKKLQWKCPMNHIFEMSPNTRTNLNQECPICTNRKVLSGFNDLVTTHPRLAKEAIGWNPAEFTAGMAHKVEWVCEIGHRWMSAIYSRAGNDRGCPYCSHQKVLPGFNDLQTTDPKLASEAFGWDPSTVISGSGKAFEWICSMGHTFKATITNRKGTGGTGCPYCTNKKVLVGFNDLTTTSEPILQFVDGWDPQSFTAHSDAKMSWKCEYGHRWKAQISNVTNGTRCPSCAKYGFNPGKDAHLYFLEHQVWAMYQIGISNDIDYRLGMHLKFGWEVIELRGPMDGHLTQQWETAILRMLKAKGADLANASIAGKFDGYSEAWSKSTFEVGSIKELMRLTEEFESN